MTVFSRIRILPLLVLVASLSFAIRTGDFISGLQNMGAAHAEESPPAVEETADVPPPLPGRPVVGDKPQEKAGESSGHPADESSETKKEEKHSETPLPSEPPAVEAKEATDWKDSADAALEYSPVQEDLYKDLARRREELDGRERELATRQALLEAGEREVDQKLRELTSLRNQIEGMMKKQTDEEKTRVESLVKIYEAMKPKDAARIFDSLDMDVLIQVMTSMSERKSAPIIAEMSADRARAVTVLMAQQRQLPGLGPQ